MSGLGIFFAVSHAGGMSDTLDAMDKITQDWTMRAARDECSWVCSDCCMTFPEGMPDECAHGHQGCTDIIKRDKADAMSATPPAAEGGA
ncbi:hypothetical protein [Cupriavidus sp. BIC8F]|uniref:hypothetical protein n=1 Tax=Cupriavidus sp. BIC8F TaxID=3079014 RepID=UPI002916EEC0|nr:hypothetical protein [Cupriavidus sp. BIC8F]